MAWVQWSVGSSQLPVGSGEWRVVSGELVDAGCRVPPPPPQALGSFYQALAWGLGEDLLHLSCSIRHLPWATCLDSHFQGNILPVIRSRASMYRDRVPAITVSGSPGGGLALSQPVVSSQSLTNCLSNDGCGP